MINKIINMIAKSGEKLAYIVTYVSVRIMSFIFGMLSVLFSFFIPIVRKSLVIVLIFTITIMLLYYIFL